MLIASLQDAGCHYGTQTILEGASFKLSSGQRLGLIGHNGAGKTTILRLLLGEIEPTSGSVSLSKAARIGYVPQHVEFEPEDTVMDCVFQDYRKLVERLRAEEDRLGETSEDDFESALARFQKVREEYDAIDGDQIPQRAEAMLDALGLQDRAEQKVAQLSGGEKVVVAMARALLAEPDLLILDEPGNHLDYQGLDWLISFLNQHKGAILMVSHNRYLLDRTVDGILELERGALTYYDGGYSRYRSTKLRNLLSQQADYTANQKRLERLEQLVKKFEQIARVHADKAWGRRLRARRSQLEREQSQAVDRPELEAPKLRTKFGSEKTRADIALRIRGYDKSFGELSLLRGAELDISCGERVALVGPNGCGKTSLLRDIVEHGSWDSRTIQIGPSLRVGYGAQEKELPNARETLLDEIKATVPMTDGQAFALLSRLAFSAEDVRKSVADLSGGERNRLQLAKLMVTQPNFLILDEPTNHLDIPSREAIEEALQDFEGTLLVVSHDRYFLEKIVDRVVEFRDASLHSFPGSFSEYWQSKRIPSVRKSSGRTSQRRKQREQTAASGSAPSSGSSVSSGSASPKIELLERKISAAETEKEELEARMAEAFTHNDVELGKRLQKQATRLQASLDELFQQWERAIDG